MSAFPELRQCLYFFGKKRSIGKKQERERTSRNTCGSVYVIKMHGEDKYFLHCIEREREKTSRPKFCFVFNLFIYLWFLLCGFDFIVLLFLMFCLVFFVVVWLCCFCFAFCLSFCCVVFCCFVFCKFRKKLKRGYILFFFPNWKCLLTF